MYKLNYSTIGIIGFAKYSSQHSLYNNFYLNVSQSIYVIFVWSLESSDFNELSKE